MPSAEIVRLWLIDGKHQDFFGQYAQAREIQADHYFEEMFEIADDGSNDWMERRRRGGTSELVLNDEHVQRSRLRVDTRKWALARMSPKKYGDRMEHEHHGDLHVHYPPDWQPVDSAVGVRVGQHGATEPSASDPASHPRVGG